MELANDPCRAAMLYEKVSMIPGEPTKEYLYSKYGLSIGGQWNHMYINGVILSAVDANGKPALVKPLLKGNDEAAMEKIAHNTLDIDIHLVPGTIVRRDLQEDKKENHREFIALCMPHFSNSLYLLPQMPRKAIYEGGIRILKALEIIHSKGLAHMDVKPANIFVDMNGNWFLGDYGSCVELEKPLGSATSEFLPFFVEVASKELDEFQLLTTLVVLLNKDGASPIERGGYAHPHLIKERIDKDKESANDELSGFMQELARRSPYFSSFYSPAE